jgi:hypothetical protein
MLRNWILGHRDTPGRLGLGTGRGVVLQTGGSSFSDYASGSTFHFSEISMAM